MKDIRQPADACDLHIRPRAFSLQRLADRIRLRRRQQDLPEAHADRLADDLLRILHRPQIAGQADLADGHHIFVPDDALHRRPHRHRDRQVRAGAVRMQPADDIHVDILIRQTESDAALQHRQDHIETPVIKADRCPAGIVHVGRRRQRLHFEKQRARAVKGCAYGGAAEAFLVHRDEHLGRVGDLPEACGGHFKYSQFRSGAKTVLYAAEDAVCAAVFGAVLVFLRYYMVKNKESKDMI